MTTQPTLTRPLHTAHDADLRLSQQALQRAAQRARELARQTGTAIVVSNHGQLELLHGEAASSVPAAHEPAAPYRRQP